MRVRLGAVLESLNTDYEERIELRRYLKQELGVAVSGAIADLFEQLQEVRDVLDSITIVYHWCEELDQLQRSSGDFRLSGIWLRSARRIFQEEHLGYRIDDEAVVHFAVDEHFERTRATTLNGLGVARYRAARREFKAAHDALNSTPPNGKQAIRSVFAAVETVFKLMFPRAVRIGAEEIRSNLLPAIRTINAADATASRSAEKAGRSLTEWVDSAHFYRHAQGQEEPIDPPIEMTILLVSSGTAFLRWLISIDGASRTEAGRLAGSPTARQPSRSS